MAEVHEGGCVCGAIRYRVTADPLRVCACYCTFCQRRTGSRSTGMFGHDEVFGVTNAQLTDAHAEYAVAKAPMNARQLVRGCLGYVP
jgi:hypothetical protein